MILKDSTKSKSYDHRNVTLSGSAVKMLVAEGSAFANIPKFHFFVDVVA